LRSPANQPNVVSCRERPAKGASGKRRRRFAGALPEIRLERSKNIEKQQGETTMFQALTKTAAGIALAAAVSLAATAATAADLPKNSFKVVGTWGNLSNYKNHEGPFWNETVPEHSNGAITAHAPPLTELGLKGFEVMRLLKLGVFDFAFASIGYVSSEDAVFEGVDLSGIAPSIESMRKVAQLYRPVLDKAFADIFEAKLMVLYPFPSQLIFCNADIKSVADLKGKRIRGYSTTLGDFVEGAGASSVTISFAEVVPALQKGVADCGITGTMPAYQAKWHQVITHVLKLRVGWGMAFGAFSMKRWNQLDTATQEFFTKEFAALEDEMWTATKAEDEMGIICNTGTGKCTEGEPGQMKLVEASADDEKARQRILTNFVLKRWAGRCSAQCVKDWNATVGKYLNLTAKAN
jgi:TRAP-type C4-dicarboxylate transport system substrate-binding protein